MTIGPYTHACYRHEPGRKRKLLLRKREIDKLAGELRAKGKAWVPTRLYFSAGWLKIEMALGVGKKLHDKREDVRKKDAQREIARSMSRRSR